jgi:hypothetical protein
LTDSSLLTLKTGKTLDDYSQGLTGMAYVQFEVAQRDAYRFFEYLQPSYYRQIDSDAM